MSIDFITDKYTPFSSPYKVNTNKVTKRELRIIQRRRKVGTELKKTKIPHLVRRLLKGFMPVTW